MVLITTPYNHNSYGPYNRSYMNTNNHFVLNGSHQTIAAVLFLFYDFLSFVYLFC